MAEEREDIVFQLKVEQGDALTEMERFKKSILQTKQEQQELTKAYKQGNITLDEFVKEQVRLESILKKQQSSYNNVQKSVTGVKTQLDKLIDSNKKISKSFEDTAKEINVAGFSMGDLTSKLTAFANPATAAVGLVGALGAAYASSTIGARDLKHAQDQLSAAFTITNNSFADFIDNLGGGDGTGQGGFLSKLAFFANTKLFGLNTAILGSISADSKRQLQELELAEIESKRRAKDALDAAEDLRRTRDREDLELKARLSAAYSVQAFIDERERELVRVQEDKLQALNDLLKLDQQNLEIKKQVKLVEFEIADIREDSEGKRTEALNGIIKLEAEPARLALEAAKAKAKTDADAAKAKEKADNEEIDRWSKVLDAHFQGLEAQAEADKAYHAGLAQLRRESAVDSEKITQMESQAKLEAASMVANGLAGIMEEGSAAQRFFALLSIGADTAEAIAALTAASEQNPANGFTFGGAGILQYATGIARILGNIATAKGYLGGFADGGWTGPGSKYQPVGIVHADEYVTPKHIVHSAAAQPHLAALERMRLKGYADGGLAVNSMTAETNQNVMVANMMKHMPRPQVEVVEITRGIRNVDVKERGVKPFRK